METSQILVWVAWADIIILSVCWIFKRLAALAGVILAVWLIWRRWRGKMR